MPPKIDQAMERLSVHLQKDENWSFNKIKDHVSLSKGGVIKIYKKAETSKNN